jgi:hypothetical protein
VSVRAAATRGAGTPQRHAGQVRLQLRQPWADGTTYLVFDPLEFLGRLAVLVPRPRVNLLLYHGVLGPRAAWRRTSCLGRRCRRGRASLEQGTPPVRAVTGR